MAPVSARPWFQRRVVPPLQRRAPNSGERRGVYGNGDENLRYDNCEG